MMISPESFEMEHKEDSLEELRAVRDELLAEIKAFENNETDPEEWMICPMPDVRYQCNLEYLAKVSHMIIEAYRYSRDADDNNEEQINIWNAPSPEVSK